jgi:microcystin-dependent protein
MARFLGSPKVQYFKTGTVEYLSGGKAYFYEPNTTTLKNTYPTIADATAGTNANANPVILDSRGEASIVINGNTKMILKDASDNTIWTQDDMDSGSGDIIASNGSELLRFVSTASAVNEWTITNAATTGAPIFAATGGDTNVAGKIASKGSGILYLDGGSTGTIDLGTTSTGDINLKRAVVATGAVTTQGTLTSSGAFVASVGSTFTGAITANSTIAANGLVTLNAGLSLTSGQAFNLIPAGSYMWMAGTTVPSGWLECDGSVISRTTYSALFTAISTTYGAGDGSTTFSIPTQARRTLVGKGGSGTATLANTVGATGGAESVTLATTNLPTVVACANANPSAVVVSGGSGLIVPAASSWGGGGGTATSLIQPSLVGMLCIRAF